ncbi:MAG: hypothetical protein L6R41_000012 [Letrouitia leprolyta]|nr:MAG: hypothetical protein L6R41_000012 [Letrouitia leprolyta]
MRRRLSRTDSLALQSPSGGASAASSSSRLLIDTPNSDLNEEQIVQEQIKDKVWTDSLAAQNHVSSPIDEDKHPDSVKTPIRRRSLYTPGIATRSPEDILQKPPPPSQLSCQADREYYYNPSLPDSSPLARLANLRPMQAGRSTPSELDYTHLGALKLGTLRVTNGTASPVPRERHVSSGPTSLESRPQSRDEYYATSREGKDEATVLSAEKAAPAHPISSSVNRRPLEPLITMDTKPAFHDHSSMDTMSSSSMSQSPCNSRLIKRKPVPSANPNREMHPSPYLKIDCSSELLTNSYSRATPAIRKDDGSRDAAYLKLTKNHQNHYGFWKEASEKGEEPGIECSPGKSFLPVDSGYSSNVSLEMFEKSTAGEIFEVSASVMPDKVRRLQKRRPKSQSPLQRTQTSVDDGFSENEIPPVPNAIANLHYQRMSVFPPIDHTYEDSQYTDAEETPSNPVSMPIETQFPSPTFISENSPKKEKTESLFQKLASRARSRSRSRPKVPQPTYKSDDESVRSICRSPSWSEYRNTKKKELKKKEKADREFRRQSGPEQPTETETSPRSRPRSRSRFRSKSRGRSSRCTDFGAVGDSLGASPYDVARLRGRMPQRVEGKRIQSHHIGTVKPCTESRNDMIENDVPRSRMRSRSLIPNDGAYSRDIQDHSPLSSKAARPSSMYVHRPPVPALPVVDVMQKSCNSQPASPPKKGQIESLSRPSSKPGSLGAPVGAPDSNATTSMEELIDKLLDAPDSASREVILQQIRQHKRGSKDRIGEPLKKADSPLNVQESAKTAPEQTNPSKSTDSPQNSILDSEAQATGSAAEVGLPPSMFAGAPPIPSLPTTEYLELQEERRLIAKSDKQKTLTPPQSQAALGTSKKDLWASCTVQVERRKANGPSSDWDSHRLAWSQRRKSAGEALLSRYRQSDKADITHTSRQKDALQDNSRNPVIARAMTAAPAGLEPLPSPSSGQKAFHRPWPPSPPSRSQEVIIDSNFTNPMERTNKVAATTQTFERLTGRFEGGLLYGYEPGFGLGGSAGTRGTKNGATRKSIQISQGFGVDLSDVPIFVAPSR